jgi:hypothetical protein
MSMSGVRGGDLRAGLCLAMLYSFNAAILSLQIKYKALQFTETKILSKVFSFNLVQFCLIVDNQRQLISGKRARYLHLGHYTPKNRTRINFPKNEFLSDKKL